MVIRYVTAKFHDAIVKCEDQNSIGKGEDSETLDISYGPRSMESDIGSILTLNCEVDGNPTPDIVWIQHQIDRVVGFSSTFRLGPAINCQPPQNFLTNKVSE